MKIRIECWNCGGDGRIAGCFEDTCSCMGDPTEPDDCCAPRRCDICKGKGGYEVDSDSEAAQEAYNDGRL